MTNAYHSREVFSSSLILDGISLPQLTFAQVNSPLNVVSSVEKKKSPKIMLLDVKGNLKKKKKTTMQFLIT